MQVEKSSKSSSSLSEEIQKIADKIKSDVEKQLHHAFKKFQVVESDTLKNEKEPESTSYSMKVNTDDADQGHLRLRTTRKDPSSNWLTDIEEMFLPMSPFESMLSTFDPTKTGFSSIQKLADRIQNDVEKELNRSFKTFDVMEHHPILTDPKHTSYYMRVKTDDNGHVRVKTIKKTPTSDWETHVEEYHRGKPSMEGEKKMSLEGGKEQSSMMGEKGKMQGSGGMMQEGRMQEGRMQEGRGMGTKEKSGMEVEQEGMSKKMGM